MGALTLNEPNWENQTGVGDYWKRSHVDIRQIWHRSVSGGCECNEPVRLGAEDLGALDDLTAYIAPDDVQEMGIDQPKAHGSGARKAKPMAGLISVAWYSPASGRQFGTPHERGSGPRRHGCF